jgi:hypothetical protein
MAETINLKKRLIGKEDIDFDITGTNEQENFFTADGGAKQLSKLNASHIPLLQETRSKVNAVNVDDALAKISEKIDNFEASDVLGEDLTINFLPEDDTETIQLKINQQKKNLNGHTLTFLFPASLQQNLYSTLEWNDFYNGTVVIAGGREDSRIAIYDNLNINSLFRFYRCQCEVIIRYFYFVHQYSPYAISAESSSAVIVEKCNFAGITGEDSYAVNKNAANAVLLDCELSEDIEFYPLEDAGMGKHLGEIFAYPGAVPPEGAYLLNGQTIAGCNELYPKFWEWVQSAGVWLIDNDTYEAELAKYGVCGGFVINSAMGSVRLPKWKYQAPLGDTLPVRGNGMVVGLTDGTSNRGLGTGVLNGNQVAWAVTGQYGKPVGTVNNTNSPATSGLLGAGVTTDPDKSGIVAENNAPTDHFVWCIQVYNAATALSEQESAQLASQMQTKAQTDLANVDSKLDWVVENWDDGQGNGYSLYRSGKLEQWGIYKPTSANNIRVISLWKEFDSSKYVVFPVKYQSVSTSWGSSTGLGVFNLTPTGFSMGSSGDGSVDVYTQWFAIGKAATE